MDALLSLPVMGYFLMPSLSTYSASLNLLFFYMTWSTLVLSHSPLKVEVLGTLGIRVLFFLVPSALFLLFDTVLPSLAVNIKRQGTSSLPTRTGGSKVTKSNKQPQWYSVVGLSSLNILISIALQGAIDYLCTDILYIRSILRVTTTLPMPWSIATGVMRAFAMREILQYYIHRYILHPKQQTYISNLHQRYAHALTSPYSFTAHYDHPLPYLLHRFLPLYLPCLLRTHLLTYLLSLSLVTLEETLAFSGYTIIPGILLGGVARRQDAHCQAKGRGNYAPWGLLDWVHSTGLGNGVQDDLGDEVEKHQLKGRGGGWLDGAKDGVRGVTARRKIGKHA